MLNLKEFETSLRSVTSEEIAKKKVRGMYVPYIQMILKKAAIVPVGRFVEIDVKDPKHAMALAQSIRTYLKKIGDDEKYTAGNFKTFVFCGKRNGSDGKVK